MRGMKNIITFNNSNIFIYDGNEPVSFLFLFHVAFHL